MKGGGTPHLSCISRFPDKKIKRWGVGKFLRRARKFLDFAPHLSCFSRFLAIACQIWGPELTIFSLNVPHFLCFSRFWPKKTKHEEYVARSAKIFGFWTSSFVYLTLFGTERANVGSKNEQKVPHLSCFLPFLALFYPLTFRVFHTFLTQNPKGGEFPPPKNKKKWAI